MLLLRREPVRRRRFARFVSFLAYGVAIFSAAPLFRTGMICVIFVWSTARIRLPPGRLGKSRKRAFLSLDAERIFMKVDALTAEKVVSRVTTDEFQLAVRCTFSWALGKVY